jgi:hypothetical protein
MFANLFVSALAFNAPAMRAPTAARSSVSMGFEGALGAQPPLGLFDPLGLLKNADQERFDRLRYVELKHGRICMLAVLGHIVTSAGIRLPGNIDYEGTSFASIPSGFKAFESISLAGTAQIVAFVGWLGTLDRARETAALRIAPRPPLSGTRALTRLRRPPRVLALRRAERDEGCHWRGRVSGRLPQRLH